MLTQKLNLTLKLTLYVKLTLTRTITFRKRLNPKKEKIIAQMSLCHFGRWKQVCPINMIEYINQLTRSLFYNLYFSRIIFFKCIELFICNDFFKDIRTDKEFVSFLFA